MALLARHVAYNGEWPIFFYGLPYMGPIEGYIAAPLFHIFGPSTFALRLGLLPFFLLFVSCMYYLTRLLYTSGLALFTVVLLCFGSSEIISRQIKGVGEYPEIVFFCRCNLPDTCLAGSFLVYA
jgi:4-amino-4-deoxy-L-arabinose transferase-like glycosyltransferase